MPRNCKIFIPIGLALLVFMLAPICAQESAAIEKIIKIVKSKKWEQLPQTIVCPKDGSVMVLVPAGEFRIGIPPNAPLAAKLKDAHPEHTVYLDAFYIDKTEITNEQYEKFLAERAGKKPLFAADQRFNDPAQPVVGITYGDAVSYAIWAGKRLPTEAEWEKTARGTDGRLYPWGAAFNSALCNSYHAQIKKTVKAAAYPEGASPFGALNMAGNVSEWVFDMYESEYYKNSPLKNPQGPAGNGTVRVSRGGDYTSDPEFVSSVARAPRKAYSAFPDLGFRCAVSVAEIENLLNPESAPGAQEAVGSGVSVIKKDGIAASVVSANTSPSFAQPSVNPDFAPVRYYKHLDFDGKKTIGRDEIRKSDRIGAANWKVYFQSSGQMTQAQFYNEKDALLIHIEPEYDEQGQEKTIRLYNEKGQMVYRSERTFQDGRAVKGVLYSSSGDILGDEKF